MNNQSQHDDFIESDHEKQLYRIHYVQQMRITDQRLQISMKWKNYPKDQSTWEDNSIITNDNDWCIKKYLTNYTYAQLQKWKQNIKPNNGYSYSYDINTLDIGVFGQQKSDCINKINNEQINYQIQPHLTNLCKDNQFTQQRDIFEIKVEISQEQYKNKEQQQIQSEQKQQNIQDTQISSQKQQQIKQKSDEEGSIKQSISKKYFEQKQLEDMQKQLKNGYDQQLKLQTKEGKLLKSLLQSYQDESKQESLQNFKKDYQDLLIEKQKQQVQKNTNIIDDKYNSAKSSQQMQINQIDNFQDNNYQIKNEIYQQQDNAQFHNINSIKHTNSRNNSIIQEQDYIVIEDSNEIIKSLPTDQNSLTLHSSEEQVSQKENQVEIKQKPNYELKKLSNYSKKIYKKASNIPIKKIIKEKQEYQRYEQLKLKSFRDELRANYEAQLIQMKDNLINFTGLDNTYKKREEYGQIPNNKVQQIIRHTGHIKENKKTNQIKVRLVFEVKFEDPKLVKNNYFKFHELFKHERELLKEYIENQQDLGFLTAMFSQYYQQKTQLYDQLKIPLPNSDRID